MQDVANQIEEFKAIIQKQQEELSAKDTIIQKQQDEAVTIFSPSNYKQAC